MPRMSRLNKLVSLVLAMVIGGFGLTGCGGSAPQVGDAVVSPEPGTSIPNAAATKPAGVAPPQETKPSSATAAPSASPAK